MNQNKNNFSDKLRLERQKAPNIVNAEYYNSGSNLSSTKLIYNIKKRVDAQIAASQSGDNNTEGTHQGSVTSSFNTNRMLDLLLSDRRQIPMDRVDEGQEYSKNV